MLGAEAATKDQEVASVLHQVGPAPRWLLYYATLLAILLLGKFEESRFIYFQF
jgi:hypothetical protein